MSDRPMGIQSSKTISADALADRIFDRISSICGEGEFLQQAIRFAVQDIFRELAGPPQFITGPLLCSEHDTALPCSQCNTIAEPWISHD